MALMNWSTFERTMRPNAPALSRDQLRQTYDLSMAKPSARRMILRLYRSTNSKNFAGWEDRLVALTANVPTSVFWGDQDPFISPSYASALA